MKPSKLGFLLTVLGTETVLFVTTILLFNIKVATVVVLIPLSLVLILLQGWPLARERLRTVTKQAHKSSLAQLQGQINLAGFLGSDRPLPVLTGWTLAADNAIELIRIVFERRPRIVVELGSGSSTLLLATMAARSSGIQIFSLDHDPGFADITRKRLQDSQLDDFVTVIDAPLEPRQLDDGTTIEWYGVSATEQVPSGIDLLIVDGPPGHKGSLLRYPALEVFVDRLSENATVLLDDANRQAERDAFDRWRNKYQDFDGFILKTSHGLGILQRNR